MSMSSNALPISFAASHFDIMKMTVPGLLPVITFEMVKIRTPGRIDQWMTFSG
jgi:hypothetical protein